MTEYNRGDRVKVELEAEVVFQHGGPGALTIELPLTDPNGVAVGTVVVPASAVVEHTPKPAPLPTEPGYYLAPYEPADIYELSGIGDWFRDGEPTTAAQVRHDCGSGLTRLIPESALAEAKQEAYREVVEWFDGTEHTGLPLVSPDVILDARKRFGLEPSVD